MSSILIVLPILTLLMFDLGLTLRGEDFAMVFRRPRAVLLGLVGQIFMLPALAFLVGNLLGLNEMMFAGMMLIACCPGGSSSNVFTGIARGDVALSVSLTALSSLITLVTMPIMLGAVVELPVGNLVMQNLVLVLVPVMVGMGIRAWKPDFSAGMHRVLGRLAFPLLMLLAAVFFIGNREAIIANFTAVGAAVTLLVLLGMGSGALLAFLGHLGGKVRKTLVIEIGMQNAAQAIALAGSPLVFNQPAMAIPAIVYALMMNVVLLIYVAVAKRWKN